MSSFDCRPDLYSPMGTAKEFMQERGNVLGVSIPNVNEWVLDILRGGVPENQHIGQPQSTQHSCIVKLYDKNINAFKLNEQITFIGVLEFKMPTQQENEGNKINSVEQAIINSAADDNQQQEPEAMLDNFFSGIPNEDRVPQLHAITSRKMAVLQCPDLL